MSQQDMVAFKIVLARSRRIHAEQADFPFSHPPCGVEFERRKIIEILVLATEPLPSGPVDDLGSRREQALMGLEHLYRQGCAGCEVGARGEIDQRRLAIKLL